MRRKSGSVFDKRKLAINLTVVLIACLVVIIESNIFYKGFSASPKESDVIIVLGCTVWGEEPSPKLEKRIQKAFELYESGYARKVIATGSRGYGEQIHEAAVIKKRLIEMGVPESDILEEKDSTNTLENLKYANHLIKIHGYKSAIVVTNYFHIYRSGMIAKDLKMDISFGKADMPESKVTLVLSNAREVISLLKYFTLQVFSKLKGEIFILY